MGTSGFKNKNNSSGKLEKKSNIYKMTNFSFCLEKSCDYIKQKNLINHPDYISIKDEREKINKQMQYCICKIKTDTKFGTGFFCKINDYQDNQNYLSVLITSNEILGKNEISWGKHIYLSINDESNSYEIIIDDSRLTYIDESYNITIIELKEIDHLTNICGLEIDSEAYNSESLNQFVQKSIYLLYYSDWNYSDYTCGKIKSISLDNYSFKYACQNHKGGLGCPILNMLNFKVIGILKNNNNLSGTFILGPIIKFNTIHKLKKNDFLLKTIEEKDNEEPIEIIEVNDKCVFFHDFNVAIPCSGNSIFAEVEKILYKKYPEYYDINNKFMINGKIIEKNLTVDENKCGDGYPIILMDKSERSDNEQKNQNQNQMYFNFNDFDQSSNNQISFSIHSFYN